MRREGGLVRDWGGVRGGIGREGLERHWGGLEKALWGRGRWVEKALGGGGLKEQWGGL